MLSWKSKKLLAFALLLSLVSACGPLNTMSDTTKDMDKTTKDLDQKMGDTDKQIAAMNQTMNAMAANINTMEGSMNGMSETTGSLDEKTGEMLGVTQGVAFAAFQTYYKLRQGNSSQARRDAFDDLIKPGITGDLFVGKMENKIADAATYYLGFEYQIWDGQGQDDSTTLDTLYDNAVQEFALKLGPYVPLDYSFDPLRDDNNSMVLYALAVTMHFTNPLEVPQKMDPNDPVEKPIHVSMYDLIVHALRKRAAINSGALSESSLKEWEREVLRNAPAFTYLLQVRANYLPLMILGSTSDIAVRNFLGVDLFGLFKLIRASHKLGFDWAPKIPDLENLITYTKWLTDPYGVFDTQQALRDIGADPTINTDTKVIFSHMKIDPLKVPAGFTKPGPNGFSPLYLFNAAVLKLITS